MQHLKMALASVCGVMVVIGALALSGVGPSGSSASVAYAAEPEMKTHWRHYDGHWSYWHDGDKRWYYTDGANWYYRDGEAWKVYNFDKGFGREGFERGEYKRPEEGVKIELPRHKIYIGK